MRKHRIRKFVRLAFGLMLISSMAMGVPTESTYQGRLTTPGGAPVADGPYMVTFRIYDAPVGGGIVWNAGATTVVVNTVDGLFTVNLGAAPLPALTSSVFLTTDRWLGIQVGGDPEMTPRTKLNATPWALVAATVPDNALSSSKITDEAGLSHNSLDNTLIDMDAFASLTDIRTVTITTPGFGFILVLASGQAGTEGDGVNPAYIDLQIDETAGGALSGDYIDVGIAFGPHPTSIYRWPFSMQKLYTKPGGTYTFRLEGRQGPGSVPDNSYIWDPKVTAIYFPAYYGDLFNAETSPEQKPGIPLDNTVDPQGGSQKSTGTGE